jgi:gluconolactonase
MSGRPVSVLKLFGAPAINNEGEIMNSLSRRKMIAGMTALPLAQAAAQEGAPASTSVSASAARPLLPYASVLSNPPRIYGPLAQPVAYPDADIVMEDRAVFSNLMGDHNSIQRLGTGYQWTEGPAWSNQGQYVLFSDSMGDVQYRYLWEGGIILPFRKPSYGSNGNAFDFEGRQVSCEGFFRRIIRWEHDGTMTIIADKFDGKPLNSPNDIVTHPDGSIWFSDPYYGGKFSEGHPDDGEGPQNPGGLRNPYIGDTGTGLIGGMHQVLPTQIYRWDPSGRLDVVVTGGMPNGLAFSPDYKKLYFSWTGGMSVGDVNGRKLENIRHFTDSVVDGVRTGVDGFRVDKAGNIWMGATGPVGICGVTVRDPQAKLIGRIRLPGPCANLCFAGPKRDWLFMCASESVYLVRVYIQGATPG